MSSFEKLPLAAQQPGFVPDEAVRSDRRFRSLPLVGPEPARHASEPEEPPPAPADRTPVATAEAAASAQGEPGGAAAESIDPAQSAALESAVAALETGARELAELRQHYLAANRRAVVEIALAIAERVLAREVAADPEALARMVSGALEKMDAEKAPRLLLSESDLEALRAGHAPALERLCRDADLTVASDAALGRGDVRIEGSRGGVDATLTGLLARVRDALDLGLPPAKGER